MAKQNQERVFTIKIDVDSLQKDAAATAQDLKAVTDQMKVLKKSGDEGSVTYQRLAAEQREYKKELRDINRSIDNSRRLTDSAKGSNKALRAELALLTDQYNDLGEETRESSDEAKTMQSRIKELSDTLKKNESAVGDNRRNVGNYKDSVKEAIAGTDLWNTRFVALGRAFLANPIVLVITAIVGVFSLLYTALTRSEEGQAKVNKIIAIGKGLWEGLLNILEPVANFLIDNVVEAFTKPEEAIKGLWENIKGFADFVQNEFLRLIQSTGKVFEELLAGNFSAAGDAALEALDAFTNLNPATLLLKESAKGLAENWDEISESMAESVNNAQKLVDAELALAKAQREQEATQLRFQIQAERLRQVRDDEARSIQERIEANKELGEVLQRQIRAEQALAQRAVDVAQLRINLEGRSRDNLDELADANLKLIEIQERVESQRSEQLVNTNSLLKEQKDLIEELNEKERQRAAKIQEFDEEIRKSRMSDLDRELSEIDQKYDKLYSELEAFELSKEETRAREIELIAAHERDINNVYDESRREQLEKERDAAEKRAAMTEQEYNDRIGTIRNFTSFAKSNTNEGTALFKAAAITETTISAYDWATKAAASVAKTPVIGPVLAGAAYAAALASGLASVSQITQAKRGKLFNRGKAERGASYMSVIGGKPHSLGGTKFWGDDGSFFEAEQGELIAVVNKHNTSLLSKLSDINSWGGYGDPFFARGGTFSTYLQDGGFADRASVGGGMTPEQIVELMSRSFERLPNPKVEVSEIITGVNRVQVIEDLASA